MPSASTDPHQSVSTTLNYPEAAASFLSESLCITRLNSLNGNYSTVQAIVGFQLLFVLLVVVFALATLFVHFRRTRVTAISATSPVTTESVIIYESSEDKKSISQRPRSSHSLKRPHSSESIRSSNSVGSWVNCTFYSSKPVETPSRLPSPVVFTSPINAPFALRKALKHEYVPEILWNTYDETLKLAQSCPEYLDDYLKECYGEFDLLDDDSSVDERTRPLIYMSHLTEGWFQTHTTEDIVDLFEMVRNEISLEGNTLLVRIFEFHELFAKCLTTKDIDIAIKDQVFGLVVDTISYMTEEELLHWWALFHLIDALKVCILTTPTSRKQAGYWLRCLLNVLCQIDLRDIFDVFYPLWYQGEGDQTLPLEALKVLLINSYDGIIQERDLFDLVSEKISDITLLSTDNGLNPKLRELLLVWNVMKLLVEENRPTKLFGAPLHRKLVKDATTEAPLKDRVLRVLTNMF